MTDDNLIELRLTAEQVDRVVDGLQVMAAGQVEKARKRPDTDDYALALNRGAERDRKTADEIERQLKEQS